MTRVDVRGERFMELVKANGVWFKEDLPDFEDVRKSKWELNVIDVRDGMVRKSYLAYIWNGRVEHMFDDQTFLMVIGEYNDSMDGLPFWEDYLPMLSMIEVGKRGNMPIYMGIWEECLYEVPENLL